MFGKLKAEKIEEQDDYEQLVYERDKVNINDKEERTRYLNNCMEQLAEAEKELNLLTGEYSLVTAYLTDMEEIEALPNEESKELKETANKILNLDNERSTYLSKKGRMKDSEYKQIESQEEEIEEGIEKIKEAEKYRKLVQQDLNRLDGERHAYRYRKNELNTILVNLKGMAVICLTAAVACLLMLVILQFGFHLETAIGYFVTIATAAVAVTIICLKYTEALHELEKVEQSTNKLIQLQNKVKIRYVNNANLLEYLYIKYGVDSGEKLQKLWSMYQKEKEERRQFAESEARLDYYREQLVKNLMRYRVKDPGRWIHQVRAIVDPKEMVEIRHGLIVRRQALRKQMEYNQKLAETASEEVKDIAVGYPQYKEEISTLVERYEKQFAKVY